jgi:FAD-dependent urate hydroxylase
LPIGETVLPGSLAALYQKDNSPASELIMAAGEGGMTPLTPVHYLPHLPHWHRGRMIVVGDAAHAPSGSSGQGAALAVEDAVVLARCLRDLPVDTALHRFVELLRPRVEAIIRRAAKINRTKAAGPVERAVMSLVLPVVLRRMAAGAAFRDTYAYHIDWNEPVPA